MASIFKLTNYGDIHTLIAALVMAVNGGILSREQAQGLLKDQMYESGILKRPPIFDRPEKVEPKKKE